MNLRSLLITLLIASTITIGGYKAVAIKQNDVPADVETVPSPQPSPSPSPSPTSAAQTGDEIEVRTSQKQEVSEDSSLSSIDSEVNGTVILKEDFSSL